jgi:uncharacterized membrane protein SirB2
MLLITGIFIIIALIITALLAVVPQKMKHAENKNVTDDVPKIELLIICLTYGGLLLVVLTELFWRWSGMASLGTFYLILVAPIIMGVIAYRHRHTKTNSKYNKWAYLFGLLYFVIAPVTFVLLIYCK